MLRRRTLVTGDRDRSPDDAAVGHHDLLTVATRTRTGASAYVCVSESVDAFSRSSSWSSKRRVRGLTDAPHRVWSLGQRVQTMLHGAAEERALEGPHGCTPTPAASSPRPSTPTASASAELGPAGVVAAQVGVGGRPSRPMTIRTVASDPPLRLSDRPATHVANVIA